MDKIHHWRTSDIGRATDRRIKRAKSSKSMARRDDPGWCKRRFKFIVLVVHTPRNREMQLDDGRLSLGSPGMGAVTKNYSTPPLASKKLNNMKIILRTKRKNSNDIYIYIYIRNHQSVLLPSQQWFMGTLGRELDGNCHTDVKIRVSWRICPTSKVVHNKRPSNSILLTKGQTHDHCLGGIVFWGNLASRPSSFGDWWILMFQTYFTNLQFPSK